MGDLEDSEFALAAERFHKARAEREVRLVKLVNRSQDPSEIEVDSDEVWSYKLSGWKEAD